MLPSSREGGEESRRSYLKSVAHSRPSGVTLLSHCEVVGVEQWQLQKVLDNYI